MRQFRGPAKESLILIPIPTKAEQTAAATPDAAVAQLSRGTDALTPIVESAAGEAPELSDGFAAKFKRIVGLTVDAYRQTSHYYLGDPTAWV